jgi:hypothetical protein
MVGMVMGIKHSVKPHDAIVQALLPKVRRGVNHHLGVSLPDQDRGAAAAVFWIIAVTNAPYFSDPGYSA